MGARELYEKIQREGWPLVESWVGDGEPESVGLDFKVWRNDSFKDNAAKAVSGFANTDGGVLIFGVEAKKPKEGGPDVATKIEPVPNLARSLDALKACLTSMLEPPVAGLDACAIRRSENDSHGLLAVLVPRSMAAPHRVRGGKEADRYFMRTADSTTPIPHRLLAALFAAPPEPRLTLVLSWLPNPPPDRRILVTVKNDGPGAARHVRVRVFATDWAGNQVGNLSESPLGSWDKNLGSLILPGHMRLYAEDEIQVGRMRLVDTDTLKQVDGLMVSGRVDSDTSRPIVFERELLGAGATVSLEEGFRRIESTTT